MSTDELGTLLTAAGEYIARKVVQSHVVYPRTENLRDKALHNGVFSKDLKEAISAIESSIELRAIDTVSEAVAILSLLDEYKHVVLINQADYIVIYNGGFDVIKLKNESDPNTGRSIYVEVNACRNELVRYIQSTRAAVGSNVNVNLQWVAIGGLSVVLALFIGRELAKK